MADKVPTPIPADEEILARIRRDYAPYDTLPAFDEGYAAYHTNGAYRRNPYEAERAGETRREALTREVSGQAWDRGANAAMLYAQAQHFLADPPPPYPQPAWLQRIIRGEG
jgi:hypothetical protein